MGCVGETDGKDPQMERGGRSGSQGDPNVDGWAQERVWSHAAATTSPRCAFGWFVGRLRERQSPLAAVDEGEAPIRDDEMIRHSMTFFKSTAPHIIGCGGRMLHRIEDFCGVFPFSLWCLFWNSYSYHLWDDEGLCFGSMHWGDAHRGHSFCDWHPCSPGLLGHSVFVFSLFHTPSFSFLFGAFGFSLALYFSFGNSSYGLFSWPSWFSALCFVSVPWTSFRISFLFFCLGAQGCWAIELALGTVFSFSVPYSIDAFLRSVSLYCRKVEKGHTFF